MNKITFRRRLLFNRAAGGGGRVEETKSIESFDEDYCKNLCDEASLRCLQGIHDHVIEYLERYLGTETNQDDETKIESDQSVISDASSLCSYEDWIRECHPENTSFTNNGNGSNSKKHKNGIDLRFYLQNSDHRIIWNGYCHAYGFPQLKVQSDSVDSI